MKKMIIPILLIAFACGGCVKTYYLGRIPQAQFTYPNANVTPLIKVRGKSSSKFKLLSPPSVTSTAMSQAFSDALRKSQGADVLINMDAYQKVVSIPIPIPMFFSKYIIEGTSAKQVIGKQKLGK